MQQRFAAACGALSPASGGRRPRLAAWAAMQAGAKEPPKQRARRLGAGLEREWRRNEEEGREAERGEEEEREERRERGERRRREEEEGGEGRGEEEKGGGG